MKLTKLQQQIYDLSINGITCNELQNKLKLPNKEIADAILGLIGERLLITKKQVGKELIFIQNKV